MLWWEIGLRLLCAASLGALVGLERQWRARTAGLRTNALVCVGAALFELFSVLTPDGGSTTRIASYIVSGVGFLGAGVIIRDGGNLRGINTAATIWGTAGVGLMCGGGHYGVAAAGAVVIVIANVGLRSLGRLVDGRAVDPALAEADCELRAVRRDSGEARVRASARRKTGTRRQRAEPATGCHIRRLETPDTPHGGLKIIVHSGRCREIRSRSRLRYQHNRNHA